MGQVLISFGMQTTIMLSCFKLRHANYNLGELPKDDRHFVYKKCVELVCHSIYICSNYVGHHYVHYTCVLVFKIGS